MIPTLAVLPVPDWKSTELPMVDVPVQSGRKLTVPEPVMVLAAGALLEDAGDLNPKTPSRTAPVGLIARLLSGGFCGWWLTAPTGASIVTGVLLGAFGALLGTFAGLSARRRAISLIGRIPAALLEDLVAIAAAIAIVTYAAHPVVMP